MQSLAEIEHASQKSEPPRLLYVYDGEFALDNGVSNYIRTLGDYAADNGCEVSYLVGRDASNKQNAISVTGSVPVHANGSQSYVPIPTSARRIAATLEELSPDTVHVQAPFLPTMAGKVIKQLNESTTVVGTFHTPMPRGWLRAANELNARLIRQELRRFDHLYSVSETARDAAQKIYGVDSEVLPCPVALTPRSENSIKPDGTIVTFLGRLVARKDLSCLVDGLGLLEPRTKSELRFRIVGDGTDRELIERRIAANGLGGNTTFAGKVTEAKKHALLAISDIVTCPSSGGESLGITLIEAMAASHPVVIANEIGGYAEVLRDVPESLVEPGNPRMLAERLGDVIADTGLRQAIFEAQQEVVKRYDIRSVGSRLMTAYGFKPSKFKPAPETIA
jgi:phosphatidylinositol alpha-mannosyltransferase